MVWEEGVGILFVLLFGVIKPLGTGCRGPNSFLRR